MIEQEFANKYLIYKCLAGSHSYGTNLPSSDRDERGLFIAPPDYVLSCTKSIEQVEKPNEDDVVYELKKFMKLAADNNPNLIELLYTDDKNVLYKDWPFDLLKSNRHLFLSKKAKFTFSGYSMAQLKRIKGHNKWIMNPQNEKAPQLSSFCRFIGHDGIPKRDQETIHELEKDCFLAETFGETQFRVYRSPEFFKDKLGFFNHDETDVRYVNVHDDILRERADFVGFFWINLDEYKKQHLEWKQYWTWKKNRNPQRAELEEKHGIDSKHAMHLVRLMRMCEEIMTIGEVHVFRHDANELLDIRNGKFSYDALIAWTEEMDAKLDELYKTSTLQHSADLVSIDNLYREIIMRYWKEKGLL